MSINCTLRVGWARLVVDIEVISLLCRMTRVWPLSVVTLNVLAVFCLVRVRSLVVILTLASLAAVGLWPNFVRSPVMGLAMDPT